MQVLVRNKLSKSPSLEKTNNWLVRFGRTIWSFHRWLLFQIFHFDQITCIQNNSFSVDQIRIQGSIIKKTLKSKRSFFAVYQDHGVIPHVYAYVYSISAWLYLRLTFNNSLVTAIRLWWTSKIWKKSWAAWYVAMLSGRLNESLVSLTLKKISREKKIDFNWKLKVQLWEVRPRQPTSPHKPQTTSPQAHTQAYMHRISSALFTHLTVDKSLMKDFNARSRSDSFECL